MSAIAPESNGLSFLLIEAGVTLTSIAAAFCWPRLGSSLFVQISRLASALGRQRALSVLAIGMAAFVSRLLLLPIVGIPKGFIHDDFSFLLAADTFASGRLTNPTHPMWRHFESFHITHIPTYMSMYFPAQGLVLAAGKVVVKDPWFGVLVSTALMCAALCWMLQAWLPPKWALLGGFIAILRLGLFSYWMNTFSGGSVAALGGALVVGALPRIWRKWRSRDLFWMALGIAILANSRPYEGLLICLPVIGVLFWKLRKSSHPGISILLRRSAPALLLLMATVAFMAYYDYRVFGSVFTIPYTVNRQMYAMAPHFLWQKPRPEPFYRHWVMRDFYAGWELDCFLKYRTFSGFLEMNASKVAYAEVFFLGFALLPPMVMLPRALKDRRMRPLWVIAATFVSGLAIETWLIPHYMAPFTAVFYAILLQCMRHMRAWRFERRPTGKFLIRAIPAICVVLCIVRIFAAPLHLWLTTDRFSSRAWFGTYRLGSARYRIASQMSHLRGKQLLLVRYSPKHDIFNDWVYNSADIDKSEVVWARDMGPANNAELIQYFSDRTVWLVQPDVTPTKVSLYMGQKANGTDLPADSLTQVKLLSPNQEREEAKDDQR